jgi:hypothetical protein
MRRERGGVGERREGAKGGSGKGGGKRREGRESMRGGEEIEGRNERV